MGTFPMVTVALAAVWRAVIMILQGDLDRQYLGDWFWVFTETH